MSILITGFPYVRERYFATWRSYPEPDELYFLLPRVWTAKEGKVTFRPPSDERVSTTRTLFPHSHFPIIGGLLKGWMPAFPLHLWKFRKHVKLVYACSEPILLTTLYFGLFTRLMGKKLVLFTWENIPYEKKLRGMSRFIHLAILHLNFLLMDGLICGNPEGELIHRQYTRKPISVIPMNGLDQEIFRRRDDVREHSHLTRHTVFTFIGAIGYRKGIHLAVRALPEVLRQVPDAHLVIAGRGEYEKELDRLIDELGLHEHVTRFNWIDQHEIVRLLSVSSVFIYPSIPHGGWAEQFGYSMAEASLMELPVISTRSGSIPHVVIEGTTGLLVQPDDPRGLIHAMIELGRNEDLRRRLGRAGREYVIELFSHGVVSEKFNRFFDSLMIARPR